MRTSSAAEQNPPPETLAHENGRPASLAPLWTVVSLVILAFAARFTLLQQLPFPVCWLRKLTGIPCPSCGCTRSLAAWASLDLEQAFRFNPFFFIACVGAFVWFGMWVGEKTSGRQLLTPFRERAKRWPLWRIGLALLALNWLYLCLTLPK